MLGKSKQRQLQEQIAEYCDQIKRCLEVFEGALAGYCRDHERSVLLKGWEDVHKAESRADDLRRSTEILMYTKTLFPESRGDIMGLLETMDRVPNQTESVIRSLRNGYVQIPDDLVPGVLELAAICRECGEAMIEAVGQLFANYLHAAEIALKIDGLESKADALESQLIQSLFAGDAPDLQKVLVRDVIKSIAGISDRAEDVGDRIRIIVAKRSI